MTNPKAKQLKNKMGLFLGLSTYLDRFFSVFERKWSRKTIYTLLFFIILLGFGLRYSRWLLEPIISRDGIYYVQQAELWYEQGLDKVLSQQHTAVEPMFLWVMKSLMSLGFTAEYAGVFCNIMLGSLLALLLFYWAKTLFNNDKIALFAALLTAIHPVLVKLSHEVQREIIYLFFVLLILIFLTLAIRTRKARFIFIAGVVTCPALLSRYEAYEIPILLLIFIAGIFFKDYREWKKILSCSLNYSAGLLSGFLLLSLICGISLNYYKFLFVRGTGYLERFF